MLSSRTRWKINECDPQQVEQLVRECAISPLLARLLLNRGIATPEQAKAFLQIDAAQFRDPYLLDGMERAVERIRRAIQTGEPICLYGDYDADGVSSTALMIHVMRELGATFDYYIPNRFTEGYGLNNEAIRQIAERGFRLVVTVDTGISAVEQVAYANQLGLDVIVTDHHEPPAVLPDAYAVINPKKPGCPYPFDMLAGVGVAFKLAHALLGEPPMHLVDIAAIGTIADLVPLVDENRLLAHFGLKQMNRTSHVGLQALISQCGLGGKELTAGNIGFAIGPRINAGGRLETAAAAVKLLTTDDPEEAQALAETLDQYNRERQDLVTAMAQEAEEMVLSQFPPDEHSFLLVAKEGWNVGVVGIVASRLVEKFYRPTIVLSIDPEKGTAKGSARSIAGFDMYEALTACKEWLLHYGGHTMAAGMTLSVEHIDQLRQELNRLAKEKLGPDDFIPQIRVDAAVKLHEITLEAVRGLEVLEPYGMGNPTPVFLLEDVRTSGLRKIGRDDSHLKCTLISEEGVQVDAVGFGLATVAEHVTPVASLRVVGELSVNEWNGIQKPQIILKDLSVPHRQIFDWRGGKEQTKKWYTLVNNEQAVTIVFRPESELELVRYAALQRDERKHAIFRWDEAEAEIFRSHRSLVLYDLPRTREQVKRAMRCAVHAERIYCLFGDPDFSFDTLHVPNRDQFKALYSVFQQFSAVSKEHVDALARKLQVKRETLLRMLDVWLELNILLEEPDRYVLHPSPSKTSLHASRIYREWVEETELTSELLLSSYESLVQTLNQWGNPS